MADKDMKALKPLRERVVVMPDADRGRATGEAKQRRASASLLLVNEPDHAHRSVPPGGRRASRYKRSMVAETLAALYGEESRQDIEAEEAAADLSSELANPRARRSVLRKAGEEDRAGGTKPSSRIRRKGFFGF